MNLIEQLGGYEQAKHEFEMIKEMKPIYPGEIETNDRLLLEYRRQHNIFEAGDFIVYGSITALFVVEQEGTPMLLRHSRTGRIFRKPVGGNMRHASDEEIKAGKRLEVNDGST
ncbi:hypothetical protein [Acinetobacter lwoffii]|uniref:hypothetical protein n=1 Tax=Acinetobacter lwoffii TaxID=28090 RepID=UPI00300927C5